jgi:hypothetical protein
MLNAFCKCQGLKAEFLKLASEGQKVNESSAFLYLFFFSEPCILTFSESKVKPFQNRLARCFSLTALDQLRKKCFPYCSCRLESEIKRILD